MRASPALSLRMDAAFGKTQVAEAPEEATGTVIFLHGLGDTGSGWTKMRDTISVPHVKFLCPTAPTREVSVCDGMSMPAWFDIDGLSPSELRSDSDGIQRSVDHVLKIVDEEIASGTPSDRIVIAGFSQGGNIALAAAMQAKVPLGGAIGLSTWFPRGIADKPDPVNRKMPIFIGHGENDPIAKAEWGSKTFEYLTGIGMPTEGNIYPEMGHEFKPAQVTDLKVFINRVLGTQETVTLSKPLGMTLEEGGEDEGTVVVSGVKEGGSAAQSGAIQVGDQVLSVNGKVVKGQGFDAAMDAIIAAEGDVEVRLNRPPADRTVAWTTLSQEEQDRRLNTSGGIIKVCTDRACMNQGSKATVRWLTELTPETFSVTRCSCTGSCGKGPNVVVSGRDKEEKVVYETNSVGQAVKMLMEEFELSVDPKKVQNLINPEKNVEFGMSDELVRQGLMQTVDVRSSFAGNRF
uniref:PDZ domain-containing protein n=1 Tax=Hemiselmis tepida TaxID=464990 RepID=A0A7S0YVD5_9CRYP